MTSSSSSADIFNWLQLFRGAGNEGDQDFDPDRPGLGRGGLSGSKAWSFSFPAPRIICFRLKISALLLLEVMMFGRDLFSNFLQYILILCTLI